MAYRLFLMLGSMVHTGDMDIASVQNGLAVGSSPLKGASNPVKGYSKFAFNKQGVLRCPNLMLL